MSQALSTIDPGELALDGKYAFSISDLAWMKRLNPKERLFIVRYLKIFERLDDAKSIKREAALIARDCKPFGKGFSAKSIKDKYRAFVQSDRDKRTLVRNWNNGYEPLCAEFVEYWIRIATENKRRDGTRAARSRLIHQIWAKGEPVPGYGTWRQWWLKEHPEKRLPSSCPTDNYSLPRGWGYSNLTRYLPKRSTVELLRSGFKSAHDYQKHLKRDRSNLRPLQLIAIDDFWIDQLVYEKVRGKSKPCRAVGIMAIDVATGMHLGFLLKARSEDEFGRREGIRQAEVKTLIRYILQAYGLPPYPVTLLVENASASISSETELMLQANFGDRIRVERTGVYNDLLLECGFAETGGKPWIKTWVESFFRLLHTTAGHLPGQTGNRYDNAPGNLKSLQKYCEKLLGHPALELEDLDRLRLPIMSIDDARRIYAALLDTLADRRDHRLQGFDTVTMWRREKGDEWQPESAMAQLSPDEAKSIEIANMDETPAERFRKLFPSQAQMSPICDALLWGLYAHEKPTRIKDGKICFSISKASREELEYWQENCELLLDNEREGVIAYYDLDDMSRILITTDGPSDKRRYLGSLPRDGAVDMLDQAATGKAAGAVKRDRDREIEYARSIAKEENERLEREREYSDFVVERAKKRKRGRIQSRMTQSVIDDTDAVEMEDLFHDEYEETEAIEGDDLSNILKD